MKRKLIGMAVDLFAAAVLVLGVWIFNYLLPQKGVPANPSEGVLSVISQLNENALPAAEAVCREAPGCLEKVIQACKVTLRCPTETVCKEVPGCLEKVIQACREVPHCPGKTERRRQAHLPVCRTCI